MPIWISKSQVPPWVLGSMEYSIPQILLSETVTFGQYCCWKFEHAILNFCLMKAIEGSICPTTSHSREFSTTSTVTWKE